MVIVFFWTGLYSFLPIAEAINVRPTVVLAAMSFSGSAALALLHYRFAKSRIRAAQDLDASFKYIYQTSRTQEVRDTARK